METTATTSSEMSETEMSMKPSDDEKRFLRSVYNKSALTILIAYILMNIAVTLLGIIFYFPSAITIIQSGGTVTDVQNYIFENMAPMWMAQAVGTAIALFVSYLIGCKFSKIKLSVPFKGSKLTPAFIGMSIVLALGFQHVGSYLAEGTVQLLQLIGINPSMPVDLSTNGDISLTIWLGLSICIVAPIFEELIYRGIVLRLFSSVNAWFGIIASSLLFGLMHGNIAQFIGASFMGFAFALAAKKSGSVIPSIIMHFCTNTSVFLLQIFSPMIDEHILNIAWLILSVLVIIGSIVILIRNRSMFLPEKGRPQDKSRCLPILLSSWSFWVFVALMAVVFAVMLA